MQRLSLAATASEAVADPRPQAPAGGVRAAGNGHMTPRTAVAAAAAATIGPQG
jgi:hypothetical protein